MTRLRRPTQHHDLVEVIWDDASGQRHGWTDKGETPEPELALSVGWLIVDGEQYVVIAQDTDDDGAHNGRSQIPRGMVRRIRVIRRKDKAAEPNRSQPTTAPDKPSA